MKKQKVKKRKSKEEKISKEMMNLIKAINAFSDKYKGNVSFIGSFIAFDTKLADIVEDRMFSYGPKEVLKEEIYALAEVVATSEEEFVNV